MWEGDWNKLGVTDSLAQVYHYTLVKSNWYKKAAQYDKSDYTWGATNPMASITHYFLITIAKKRPPQTQEGSSDI